MRNENPKENYISAVLTQIRWSKARPVIQAELEGHIEEHRLDAKTGGLDDTAALAQAVAAMGDPLDTGHRLNKLHKPKVDALMLISAAVLVAITLALIIYSVFAQYQEPAYLQALAVTAVGFGIGILLASIDVRSMIAKAWRPLVIGGLAGLLIYFIAWRFLIYPIFLNTVTPTTLSVLDWIDLLPNCSLLAFLVGFSGWITRLKKGSTLGGILAVSAAIAAATLLRFSGRQENMACIVIACLLILLCSHADMKWKAVFTVLTVGAIVYMVLFYSEIAAYYAEVNKTNHSVPLVQTALQHVKDLKLIGYAIPAPAKDLYAAFSQPFGFILLHYGILPALLPYAVIGLLVWRMLRSPLHIHDRLGRTLASGAAVYFTARFILTLLNDIFAKGLTSTSIPFIPTYGQETALTAGLLGLLFGLYRRKELYFNEGLKRIP